MSNLASKLESWANINSYSYNLEGLAKMLALLKSEFASFKTKLSIEEIELKPEVHINNRGEKEINQLGKMLVVRKINPQAKVKVLLGGHMDTVYPAHHHFQTCKQLDANTLNGPGVADLKGGLIVMIEALKRLEASEHAGSIAWTVYVNPDEEIGSFGSAEIFPQLAKEHDLGLIYEPSLADGSLAYKRMGNANFTFTIHGKASHVGRDFQAGRSAAIASADLALELHALNKKYQDNNIILSVANIICEGPTNVVPALTVLRINIRVPDNKSENIIQEELKTISDKIAAKHEVKISVDGQFTRKAKVPDARLEKLYKSLQDCAREMGLEIKLFNTGGCCDGNNLWEHGLANIDTLGVRGGNIHSDAEFVLLDSIEERVELSYRFLCKLGSI